MLLNLPSLWYFVKDSARISSFTYKTASELPYLSNGQLRHLLPGLLPYLIEVCTGFPHFTVVFLCWLGKLPWYQRKSGLVVGYFKLIQNHPLKLWVKSNWPRLCDAEHKRWVPNAAYQNFVYYPTHISLEIAWNLRFNFMYNTSLFLIFYPKTVCLLFIIRLITLLLNMTISLKAQGKVGHVAKEQSCS